MEPSACLRMLPGTITALPSLRSRPSFSESGEMTTAAALVLAARLLAGAAEVLAVALAFLLPAFVLLAGLVAEAGALVVADVFALVVDGVDEIGVTAVVVAGVLVVAVVVGDAVDAAIDCFGFAFANSSTSLDGLFETGQKTAANPAKHTNSSKLQNIFITPLVLDCQPRKFDRR